MLTKCFSEDREKNTFSIPIGNCKCLQLPFGLINGISLVSTVQRLADSILSALVAEAYLMYSIAIIQIMISTVSKTLSEQLRRPDLVLN